MWYQKLKLARKVMNISTSDVERMTSLPASYVSKIENGKIEEPGFFKLVVLLKFYNLDIEDMV